MFIHRKCIQNYENFIAVCPYCTFTNTYNRRDDLKTLKPIDLEKVNCLNFDCLKKFYINYDRVYEVYKYLILDIDELKKQKRYMYCIINLAQALEAFFYYGIVIKLLFIPLKNGDIQLDEFNLISDKFHAQRKIKTLTISNLKSLLYDLYLNQKSFHTKGEIEDYIENINQYKNKYNTENIENEEILEKMQNQEISILLQKLRDEGVSDMRNNVVHKYSYRSSLQEV